MERFNASIFAWKFIKKTVAEKKNNGLFFLLLHGILNVDESCGIEKIIFIGTKKEPLWQKKHRQQKKQLIKKIITKKV